MIVADTDVLIDFLRDGVAAGVVAEKLEDGLLSTTVISRFELLSGCRSKKQETTVRSLLEILPSLSLDQPAADEAAILRRQLDGQGSGIGMADSLIAGIAISRNARLLTRNVRHFSRVEGLVLEPT